MAHSKTGNGATLTCGTSTFTMTLTSIGSLSENRVTLGDSDLSTTTYEKYIPGDLIALDPIGCEGYWDPQSSKMPPITAVAETLTITFPRGTGQTNGATIVGTGFFAQRTSPQLQNNQRQTGSFQIQFNGATGPTFTVGS